MRATIERLPPGFWCEDAGYLLCINKYLHIAWKCTVWSKRIVCVQNALPAKTENTERAVKHLRVSTEKSIN